MTSINLRDKTTTDIATAVKDHDGLLRVADAVRALMRDGLRYRKERGLGPEIKPKKIQHSKPSKRSAAVPEVKPVSSSTGQSV
jgi:hypothetical protein